MSDLTHLSYSSISLYLDCPAAWQHKYILKQPTRSAPALVFGTAMHTAIEEQVRARTLNMPLPEFHDSWANAWTQALEKDHASIDWGNDTPEQTYNEGVRMFSHPDVWNMVGNLRARVDDQGPMIERKITLNVPGVPLPVIGYIDLVAGDGVPCDIKTSSRAWSSGQAEDSLQTLFYLAGLNQAGVHDHNWRFRHLVLVKTKTPQAQVIEHTHNPKELFFLFRLIRDVWTAIEKESFPVNPVGWRCSERFCDFWMQCRGKYGNV